MSANKNKTINVLLLEDSSTDAELIMHELHSAGLKIDSRRVQTKESYINELKNFPPSIILADYSLPNFDGMSALSLAKEICPEVPFILVSGAIGDERAVDVLKAGAIDYILKDNLVRLGQAVRRALDESNKKIELKRAQEELEKYQLHLEQLVRERTADLQKTTRKLKKEVLARKKSVEALKVSEEKYRMIVTTASEGIWVVDAERRTTYVNARMASLLGYSVDEMINKSWREIVAKEDQLTSDSILKKRLNGWRASDSYELRLIRKDGAILWVNINATPRFDDSGKYVGSISLLTDITERKKLEEGLKRANEELEERVSKRTEEVTLERQRLYSVLETLPAYVVLLDQDYHIPFANRFFRERFGESQGKRCYEYLFNKSEVCENCESYKPMQTKMPHHWEWLGPDGKYYDIYDFPFKDTDGSSLILEMGIDISEQRKTEAALRELNQTLEQRVAERTTDISRSEEQFRRAIEEAPIPVIMHAEDGQVLQISRSWTELTGYSSQDIPTFETWLNRAYGEGAKEIREHVRSLFSRDQRSIDLEFPIRTAKNELRYWSFSASSPGILADGRRFVVGMAVDITERKRTEQVKDEFIGMVSHELKTPLTVIMGALATATDERLSEKQSRELINDAIEHSKILANIVNNLLELSRQQSGRLVLQTEPVSVGEIAQAVVQNLITKSNIHHLLNDIPLTLPPVQADPLRLQTILYNLVDNAIKYSPNGGEVRLTARHDGDFLVIGVSDQGLGITPDDQKRIFQSFERLGATVNNSIQGIGLGLRVCRILAEAHGGRIWVESEKDKGSTFRFTLPLSKQ